MIRIMNQHDPDLLLVSMLVSLQVETLSVKDNAREDRYVYGVVGALVETLVLFV